MESIIISKKTTVSKDSEEIIDLTSKSIEYNNSPISIIDSFYVSEDMQMRPDLVSFVGFGTTDYYDLILKFNGISNPYSLEKNNFLFIPELTWMTEQLAENKTKNKSNKEKVLSQYIDSSKKVETDSKRLDYISRVKSLVKNLPLNRISKYNLTPNLAEPGSSEVSISNSSISLGESM
jgi:hypothetical protein